MRWFRLLPGFFCLTLLAHSQTPESKQSVPVQSPPQTIAPVTFHSDLLDLSLTYPGSLVAEKMPSLDDQHAAIASKQPADEKPEYKRADQCTDKVMSAQRIDDPNKAQGTIAIYGDSRGTVIHLDPVVDASIIIARVGLECLPAEYRTQTDAMAAVMAEGFVQGPELKEIDQPIWYEIGKQRIHFAAAESTVDENASGAKIAAPSSRKWIASIAFVWKNNLVTIQIESNDLSFLNEMLHSNIAFGSEPPATLFPAEIGNGKPIQLKP